MSDFDWKGLAGKIAEVAPTIGAVLAPATGGGSVVVGAAIGAIGRALGLPEGASPQEVDAALAKATPDQLLALKKADQEFQLQMKKLDVDLVKIAADDRDSARKREAATNDWTPRILAAFVVGLYIYVQWLLLNRVIAEDMREIAMRALGTLDGALMLVLSYYFGASQPTGTPTVMDRRK